MKHIFLYIGIISVMFCGLYSCNKEEIMVYDRERAAIEFRMNSIDYSFRISGKTVDTVLIPFYLVGVPADADRTANIELVIDSTTTEPGVYEVLDAILPAGAREGNLKIKVANTQGGDFLESQLYFLIGSNESFIPGVKEQNELKLNLTNKLIRPREWDAWLERYYWGNYSTAYYAFIIEVTGETRFPYPDPVSGYNDNKAWTESEKNIFFEKVKYELRERNKRAGSLLLHDDGNAKGKEIIPGFYYTN